MQLSEQLKEQVTLEQEYDELYSSYNKLESNYGELNSRYHALQSFLIHFLKELKNEEIRLKSDKFRELYEEGEVEYFETVSCETLYSGLRIRG